MPVVFVTKDFEWKMKTAWLWLGLVAGCFMIVVNAISLSSNPFGIYILAGWLGVASACGVGLNRLYSRVQYDGMKLTASRLLAVLVVGFVLLGLAVAGQRIIEQKARSYGVVHKKVHLNMSGLDVKLALGDPQQTFHDESDFDNETWVYECSDGLVIVHVYHGKVSATQYGPNSENLTLDESEAYYPSAHPNDDPSTRYRLR